MRLPAIVRHLAYNLRGGFLIRPLIITVTLGLSGLILSSLEETFPALDRWAPRWPFPSHSDAQVAQLILGGIAASMMTVVSIVFAIVLMTLTLASMQFSPRILVSFARDRVTQWTLGVFLGTFSFCISALPAAHTYPTRTEPVWSVMGSMALGLVCVVWLLFFIHHISTAITVNHIVDNIARETEQTILGMMPKRGSFIPPLYPPDEVVAGATVTSTVSGYIRYEDLHQLGEIAKRYHISVQVARRVGHFVPMGGVLLTVSRPEKISPALEEALRGAFDIGPTRTLQQDIEFGLLQIVDIALRAISPAVNDPSTAITCVDQLSRILICVAGREPYIWRIYDPPGVLRVAAPEISLPRLIDYAYEQIRMYAKGDYAVSIRLLRALADVGGAVTDPEIRRFLAGWGERVLSGVSQRLAPEEMEEITARHAALQTALRFRPK